METLNLLNTKVYGELPKLLKKVNLWRFQSDRIVFTNGCFDLLHAGHIHTIAQAAAQGHRLVIGMNSDSSVRGLKGENRPLQKQEDRALLLAAMHFVDAVVIFDEATPEHLIKAIKPDVLVKGGDYSLEEVVGADIVMENGGEVKLAEILKDHSTSKLMEQLDK